MNTNDSGKSRKELLVELCAMKQQMTRLQKVESDLKDSEERLRILFEFAPDGYFLSDLRGRFIDGNKAAEKIVGYKRSELIGRSFLKIKLLSASDILKAATAVAKNAAGKPFGPEEFVLNHKDGTQVPVEVMTLPVRIKDQSIMLGIARDIGERKRIEKELQESEKRYRTIFEHASDGIVIMQVGGESLIVNESFARMHGYNSPQEMKNIRLQDLDTPETSQLAPERLRRLMAGETMDFEVEHYRKDGHSFPLHVSCKVIELGGKQYYLGFHRDITERKKAENALHESKEQLRALSLRLAEIQENERRALSRELHDQVGQTLSVLGINLSDMRNRLSKDDEKTSMFDDIIEQIEELTEHVHDMTLELRPTILDDYGLLSALRWYCERLSKRIGLPIRVKGKGIDSRLDLETESALFRVAQEALTNMAKHARARHGTVTLEETHSKVRLVISDDGRGFDADTVHRQNKKSGWGLMIMQERISALGGFLKIESNLGKGTRVIAEVKR
ncbi:MAG: PAS domain S-box protein [Kiritimatiellae bacterium]|nr:PAS domain S-box protein [Kiritimatiellia bacterium]MDD5522955.1 PAS domain S-box protein [Kiritimatiellia bacterium]